MQRNSEFKKDELLSTLSGLQGLLFKTSSSMNPQSKFVLQSMVIFVENLIELSERQRSDIAYLRNKISHLLTEDVQEFDIMDLDLLEIEAPSFIKVSSEKIADSIKDDDSIKCLLCDYRGKLLTQHLRMAHKMTFIEYVSKLNLPSDYPRCARSYSSVRNAIIQKKNPKTGKSHVINKHVNKAQYK